MNAKQRLEAAGWKSGTVAELFGLSKEEGQKIEERIKGDRAKNPITISDETQEKIRLAIKGVEDAGIRLGELAAQEMKRINIEASKFISGIKPITLKKNHWNS